MSEVLKPSEVFDRAADLVAPPGAWTQHTFWMLPDGTPQEYWDGAEPPVAPACFCLFGALAAVNGVIANPELNDTGPIDPFIKAAVGLPASALINRVSEWNDAPNRSQRQVVAALRKAAELARSEGQ